MRHIYFLALTALLFVGPALAGTVPDEPHVVVTGSYEVTAVPDILHISLDISEVGREVAEARASVEERSEKLIEALKALKIEKSDINSAALKITPHYNWSNRVQIYVGTEVSRTIEVILRDIGNYDLLIRSIIDAKVARINNSKLKSTKEEDLRAEALRGAVADARGKAKLLVSSFPEKLGAVYSISTVSPTTGLHRTSYQLAERSGAGAFEPGVITFSETVKAVFYLAH